MADEAGPPATPASAGVPPPEPPPPLPPSSAAATSPRTGDDPGGSHQLSPQAADSRNRTRAIEQLAHALAAYDTAEAALGARAIDGPLDSPPAPPAAAALRAAAAAVQRVSALPDDAFDAAANEAAWSALQGPRQALRAELAALQAAGGPELELLAALQAATTSALSSLEDWSAADEYTRLRVRPVTSGARA